MRRYFSPRGPEAFFSASGVSRYIKHVDIARWFSQLKPPCTRVFTLQCFLTGTCRFDSFWLKTRYRTVIIYLLYICYISVIYLLYICIPVSPFRDTRLHVLCHAPCDVGVWFFSLVGAAALLRAKAAPTGSIVFSSFSSLMSSTCKTSKTLALPPKKYRKKMEKTEKINMMFIINIFLQWCSSSIWKIWENHRKTKQTKQNGWWMLIIMFQPWKKLHMISHPFFAMFAHLKAIRWRRRSTVSTGFFNCFRLVNSTGQWRGFLDFLCGCLGSFLGGFLCGFFWCWDHSGKAFLCI